MPTYTNRPTPIVQKTRLNTVLNFIAFIGVLFTLLEFLLLWPPIIGKVPMHMDITGKVGDWAPKGFLIIFPLFVIGVYYLFSLLSKHPDKMNYPWKLTEYNAQPMYRLSISMLTWLRCEVIWLFFFLQHGFLHPAIANSLVWLVLLSTLFLLVTVFYHLYLLVTYK